MPNYRRLRVPGGTYFFTVNLLDRSADLLTKHVDLLRRSYATVCRDHPFTTVAIVVLPDHLHVVWRLPDGDDDFSTRLRLLKEGFTKGLSRNVITLPGRRAGERGVWQRRFWEHLIRDEDDLKNHVNYVHFNPVKHRYVADPADWPYSSWHDWIKDHDGPVRTPPQDWHPRHLGER